MVFMRGAREGITVGARRGRARAHIAVTLLLVAASLMASTTASAGDLDKVVAFDIQAQTLDKALLQFGAQAHVQIMFASNRILTRVQTRALRGNYTARYVLTELLKSSKLEFKELGNSVEIVPSSPAASDGEGSSSERTDPAKYKTRPAQQSKGPTAFPDPPKKKAAVRRHIQALQEVVVTGTHIQGVPISSPLMQITRQEIDRSGYTTVGDVIRSLPQNFGNSGSQTAIGSAPNTTDSLSGAPSPNLYGLGPGSTLTLVDGQRLAVDSATGAVDVSLIPLPVIDHLEVLTGGASAIYGSDAVAGVVNIVLRQPFNGVETTFVGGGTADGGGTERDVNQLVGKTWDTGGILLDYESANQDPISASQRAYTDSAGSVTTTLPGASRTSFFVSADQDIGIASAFITGLYTHRTVHEGFSNGPSYGSVEAEPGVHQFAADGGVKARLPSEWLLSMAGNFSEQRTAVAQTVLGDPPIVSPTVQEEGLVRSLEASATGPLLKMLSGTIRSAIGAGYRVETYNDEQGDKSDTPAARRTVEYTYGELDIPLIESSEKVWRRELVLDVSGRAERYSDFGHEAIPKIGLVYVPFSDLKIRGTWGRAFRAPPLYAIYNNTGLIYYKLPDNSSPTGVSDALVVSGGNRQLSPERAKTWTFGIDYTPKAAQGLTTSITYFATVYVNRIGKLANFFTALTDPRDAPFVMRDPPEAYVESLINSASYLVNLVGNPVDPANLPALVNFGFVNVVSQRIGGVDVDVRYRKALAFGEIEPFAGAALIDLRQKLVPGVPEDEISGSVFEPPKIRARAGISWAIQQWALTGIVNYTAPEINTFLPAMPRVASWTTADLNLAWHSGPMRAIGELTFTLSVDNAFNRSPPFVQFDEFVPGIHYDPLNANALGRVIRLGGAWSLP